jgi:hypothetical protein
MDTVSQNSILAKDPYPKTPGKPTARHCPSKDKEGIVYLCILKTVTAMKEKG